MTHTFAQVASLWKEEKRKYVKAASYAVYLQLCNAYILPVFASMSKVAEEDVQAFADDLLTRGYSLKTVKDAVLVLKMILRYGAKLQAWPHVEFSVHYPTAADACRKVETLTPQQQRRLLEYLRNSFSFRNLGLQICLQTGLRIGEICGLQWKDLDLADGVIHVSKTVQRIYIADGTARDYFLSIDTPKTPTSVRDIPLSSEIKSIVRTLKRVVNPDYFILSNGPVPLEPRSYRAYYYRLLARLGIPRIRFHALRHSFATRCIENRCDYKAVSAILGHASISTTLDLYVHPGYKEKKRVIDKMARVMGGYL